jgi:GntR family transcriptional regulator / MocR family aminotransferase
MLDHLSRTEIPPTGSPVMLRPWELQIIIDASCDRPVYIQIADAIISAIKTGKLRGGDALPGSRQLAAKLKLNRNTIVEALDVLQVEGWLISKERKGIFVAERLSRFQGAKRDLPKPAKRIVQKKPDIIFNDGLPDSRIAPLSELAGAYRQIFKKKGRWQLMGYSSGSGDFEFRNAIVQMLNFKRGMRLSPDEVFITRGSQMAMYLSAHCLVEKGDYIVVENPGYKPAWQAFESAGAKLLPVLVDSEGISIEEIRAHLRARKRIKGIYITPHHQFPTTVTLSLQRRLELVALSNQHGFTIIEDDYDNEFHFGQRPILPVSSFEDVENYIYIGTMSKIVAPALRIGYLASSINFLQKVTQLRKIIDVQGDNIMAQAVLQLINDGHIKRHLRRATFVYKGKRDFFEKTVNKYLSNKVQFTKPDGGLAFWLVPNKRVDLVKMQHLLLQKSVQIISPEEFSFDEPINGLRLGYASLNDSQIDEGLREIAKLL